MANNKLAGEAQITIQGKPHIVVYDWAALAKLKTAFTEEDLDGVVSGANVEILADVLAIGLHRDHPEMTKEKIMELSPPFVESVNAISEALTYAYFGEDTPKDEPKTPKKTPARKKNRAKTRKKK